MNYPTHHLEIHVHKICGSTEKFIQGDGKSVSRLINEFQPDLLFAREKLIIAGGDCLTSFRTDQVVRVDLISEPSTHLIFPPGIVDAVEMTEAEYRGLLQNTEARAQWNEKRAEDASTVAFLDVEMTGQPPLFLAVETPAGPPDDNPAAILCPLYPLVTSGTLCFRMRSGGIAALNPRHLVRYVSFPLSQPLLEAWPAERENESLAPGLFSSNHQEITSRETMEKLYR